MRESCYTLPDWVREIKTALDLRLDRLQNLSPFLIDISLREPAVGSPVGQTLKTKLDLLPALRQFGFEHIILGSLNYAMPHDLQVDDDFMMFLRDAKADMEGCFAMTDPGAVTSADGYIPSPSQIKLRDYAVPNTVHEIYLTDDSAPGNFDLSKLRRDLASSLAWMRSHIGGENGNSPRIIVNIVDGCDAFAENLTRVCEVLEFLATLPIEAVSIEDDRGTFFPFQVGAFVAIARQILPPQMKLLVHIHGGAGFENATAIEALLSGADGLWGALSKGTAVNGHASTGELLANLARAGNTAVERYRLRHLLPLATQIHEATDGQPVADDLPILGRNAYRLPLSFFRQRPGRSMDLAPETIGGEYRYRICPVVSDPAVIAGRLAEVTGIPADTFAGDMLAAMVRLMRQDLRRGIRIAYDEPDALQDLYRRAAILCDSTSTPTGRLHLAVPAV